MTEDKVPALVETLKIARDALEPFAAFVRGNAKLPKDMQLTNGSRMARKQLVAWEFQQAELAAMTIDTILKGLDHGPNKD